MIISTNFSSNSISKLILCPISQNDFLIERLTKIATNYNLNYDLVSTVCKAENKESNTFTNLDGQKIVLLGLGEKPEAIDFIKTFRSFIFQNKANLPVQISIDIQGFEIEKVEFMMSGIILGGYTLGIYKTEERKKSSFFSPKGSLVFEIDENQNSDILIESAKKGRLIAKTQLRIFDLMNAPANLKPPRVLAKWAIESGKENGFEVEVFEPTKINEIGLKALEAVSAGSLNEARFIIMQYKHPEATKTVGLVGKGVTFDTGGISIKSSSNLHLMKSDMGGAAAVLGTLELASKLKLPINIIGIIPATENTVDGNAMKPSDVIGSYSGKSIEIIDTDAEGRLILADGLGYLVKNFKTDFLIDLATLTGSCVATFGYHAGGLFCNNDQLSAQLQKAGNSISEKLWPLPLWDIYKEDISSDIADLRNYSGKPMAGAISAAKFLEVFTDNHAAWAHLDIAGVAFGDTEFAPHRMGTAFGVRLLINFLENLN